MKVTVEYECELCEEVVIVTGDYATVPPPPEGWTRCTDNTHRCAECNRAFDEVHTEVLARVRYERCELRQYKQWPTILAHNTEPVAVSGGVFDVARFMDWLDEKIQSTLDSLKRAYEMQDHTGQMWYESQRDTYLRVKNFIEDEERHTHEIIHKNAVLSGQTTRGS